MKFLLRLPIVPRRYAWVLSAVVVLYGFCLPAHLFTASTCVVLEDREGNFLGGRVASDGQWRFPASETVNDKFAAALVVFEDKRFLWHLGFDPFSLVRAVGQAVRKGSVVSGGSTLTMQVVRLSRGNGRRTVWAKCVELVLATRLELGYTKREILAMYASNAPFGGNVVGLDAAAWRYFGKLQGDLSWGEASMLAVLPNAPSLIHLGKNREALLAKRNRLLLKLLAAGVIDKETAVLAAAELLPEMPHELPHNAPHLLDRAYREHFAGNPYCVTRLRTTLVLELQQQLNAVLERYRAELKGNEVHNLAAIVLDTETGETLAYAGNVGNMEDKEHGAQVDCVNAARSTGSIMKPFLYGMMFDAGQLLPNELVSDVPTVIMGYRPENFSQTFDGSVGASKALSRSLNIPAVRLLNRYGVAKFHQNLRRWGVSTLTNPPEHYGLTLILGGAEAKLYDLVGIYASMGRTLQHFAGHSSRYDAADWHGASYQMAAAGTASPQLQTAAPFISAGAIWTAFTAMQAVERPNAEGAWEIYEGSRRVAWKTGTSWGGRDAWAIGVTPRYVVGVWIGNANGEGRPGVIGLTTAAPVLFDVFDLLPASSWWQQPYDDMRSVVVCHESGYRASLLCPHRDTIWAGQRGNEGVACPYHVLLHTDASGGWRVNANCEDVTAMRAVSWFILPPLEEQYFRLHHPEYTAPPPWRAGCVDTDASGGVRSPMQWLYPRNPTKIFVPIDLDGQLEQTVFQIAHRDPSMVVHWHLDSAYVGSTTVFHQFALRPSAGKHRLTLVDGAGVRLTQDIEVMVRK